MTAHGQQLLEGGEETDPRIVKAAKALWWHDAKRAWGRDGGDVAGENAKLSWPRVSRYYVEAAEIALRAADVL